jgi:predicted permease
MGWLRQLFSRRRRYDELSETIREHLDEKIADLMDRGMSREEAERTARREFGNVTRIEERSREVWQWPALESLLSDLRFALRQLRRSPGFAAVAILTLALGIGMNTAIFSVVNGLLFSSLHVQQEDRVVVLGRQQKGAPWNANFSLPEYHDLRAQTRNVLSNLIAERYGLDGLSAQGGKPDRVFTDYVSGNYFQTLGIQPLLGRFFLPSEGETPGADPVIILSYSYWKQHFGGDPSVVGRHASLDGHPVTIIGVAPRDYHGLVPLFSAQAYLPLAMVASMENMPLADWNKRSNLSLNLSARLESRVTSLQANTELSVVAHRFETDHSEDEKDVALGAFPLYQARTGYLDTQNTVGIIAAFFLCLATLVLLLACVNVANLLLVRATVRGRELAIRSALGASRQRLVRQMLTESILLAFFGGIGGIGLGLWGSSLLGSVNLQTDLPLYFNFGFDWHVFAFSAAIAILAGAVVGMIPAIRLARGSLNLLLREGNRNMTGSRNRFRNVLVMLQVGSAFMLLIIAGLFTRSLSSLERVDLGFNPSHVLMLTVDPGEIGYNDAQSHNFYKELLSRIRAVPGIESAATALSAPMGMTNNSLDTIMVSGYQPPPGQPSPSMAFNIISTDYFRTLQIPLVEGRNFTDADNENSSRVAIVSQAMAKKFWPNQDPIGRQFAEKGDTAHPMQVVGVAKDARYQGISGEIDPYFYMPFLQHYAQNSLETLELRATGDPAALAPTVEHVIHSMTPDLPVFEVKTLHQALYTPNGLLVFQIAAALAGIMGGLGLALAIIGVYGVLAYVVSRKTNEIGVRMALGAQRADVLRMVYKQGLWIVGTGLVFGLTAGLLVSHLLRNMIVVSATDPVTYLSVSAILLITALLACYIPARRAMRIEPMQALRAE